MRRPLPSLAAAFVLTLLAPLSALAQTCTGLCLQQVSCPSPGATTAISGTVYAPNGNDPLPNVLVYVPNAAVTPIPSGVSCSIPASGSPLVWTTTNGDGTFTLPNMPVGSSIPVVIQAGKWRRQITVPTVASCVTTPVAGSLTRLPKNKTEGDIPKMAVLTSNADVPECVLRKIGIDDTEFTIPSGNGRINFYTGTGAVINASNPPAGSALFGSSSTLNLYDATILACQGTAPATTGAEQDNVLAYANAGGRILASHQEYRWLYNKVPFSTTASWSIEQPAPVAQTVFVDSTSQRGLQLAQWLQTVGASTTLGQINLATTLHKDTNGVATGTTPFLTISNPSAVMQFTFETPVGAAAAQECGRVLYREVHSSPFSGSGGAVFPAECSATPMTADEKLFMASLFDLTNFVVPPMPMKVTYNGNGNVGGTVPVDAATYNVGDTVTVLGNTGVLNRAGFAFAGWNTAPDGSGQSYPASGSATFAMGVTPPTLYARWQALLCTLDIDGNNAIDALTDGLLLIRAMFGLTGTTVTNGALGTGHTRNDWAAVRAYLNSQCGLNLAP